MVIPDVEILAVRLFAVCFQCILQMAPTCMHGSRRPLGVRRGYGQCRRMKVVKQCSKGAFPIHYVAAPVPPLSLSGTHSHLTFALVRHHIHSVVFLKPTFSSRPLLSPYNIAAQVPQIRPLADTAHYK